MSVIAGRNPAIHPPRKKVFTKKMGVKPAGDRRIGTDAAAHSAPLHASYSDQ
jgi:hypothetical protein